MASSLRRCTRPRSETAATAPLAHFEVVAVGIPSIAERRAARLAELVVGQRRRRRRRSSAGPASGLTAATSGGSGWPVRRGRCATAFVAAWRASDRYACSSPGRSPRSVHGTPSTVVVASSVRAPCCKAWRAASSTSTDSSPRCSRSSGTVSMVVAARRRFGSRSAAVPSMPAAAGPRRPGVDVCAGGVGHPAVRGDGTGAVAQRGSAPGEPERGRRERRVGARRRSRTTAAAAAWSPANSAATPRASCGASSPGNARYTPAQVRAGVAGHRGRRARRRRGTSRRATPTGPTASMLPRTAVASSSRPASMSSAREPQVGLHARAPDGRRAGSRRVGGIDGGERQDQRRLRVVGVDQRRRQGPPRRGVRRRRARPV